MHDTTERVRQIFGKALEFATSADRAAYLDNTCASDTALREEIEALLAALERTNGFMAHPAAELRATTHPLASAENAGAFIGRYKLLEKLGEGGFGSVWVAEQKEPIKRRVALKILKLGMDTRQVIARFEAERQALAMMDHPNIAKVLDGGATDSGRPYFVMELVRGIPITRFCDESNMPLKDRLILFMQVCHAIQHAHQKGIIHRDIKPSNILVTMHDELAIPKVIDFGIAKATQGELTDKTVYTQFQQFVGTPAYMAPEQAQMSGLDIDTRSDVYGLGVLLYELLTGTTPFDARELIASGLDAMRRTIAEKEPSRPSLKVATLQEQERTTTAKRRATEVPRLLHQLKGDLDWIVMKCLEKNRTRRYETANGLAKDVERYLKQEPVLACPPTWRYRAGKLLQRHKGKVIVSAAFALALLLAMGVLGWGVRDRQARRYIAEHAAFQAMEEADNLYVQGRLADALSAAMRAEIVLRDSSVSEVLRNRSNDLISDLKLIQTLESIRSGDRDISWNNYDFDRLAAIYRTVFREHGIDFESLPIEQAAARIRARTRIAVALAGILDDYAHALNVGRSETDATRKLRAIAIAVDEDPRRRRVREALMQGDITALQALASSLTEIVQWPPAAILGLALGLKDNGQVDTAVELLRKAQQSYPGDFWINYELAMALERQGASTLQERIAFLRAALGAKPDNLRSMARLSAALLEAEQFDEAIAICQRAQRLRPNEPYIQWALSDALRGKGLGEAADSANEKALEIARAKVLIDPANPESYRDLAETLNRASQFLRDPKLYDDTVKAIRKAVELAPENRIYRHMLAQSLVDRGDTEEAISIVENVIEEQQFYSFYQTLGKALARKDEPDKAIEAYKKAIELEPNQCDLHAELAIIYANSGRQEEAIASHRRSIELEPSVAIFHSNLGWTLNGDGQAEEASASFARAIEMQPTCMPAIRGMASALAPRGELEKAFGYWRKAVDLGARSPTPMYTWFNKAQADEREYNLIFDGYPELCLFLKKEDEFKDICAFLLKRFGETTNPRVAERLARICLLNLPSPQLLPKLVELAERANVPKGSEFEWAQPYFNVTRALAAYRQDRFDQALELLQGESLKVLGPAPHLLLAMIQFRKGEQDAARKTLADAIAAFDWDTARAGIADDWIFHVLRREAESTIKP